MEGDDDSDVSVGPFYFVLIPRWGFWHKFFEVLYGGCDSYVVLACFKRCGCVKMWLKYITSVWYGLPKTWSESIFTS